MQSGQKECSEAVAVGAVLVHSGAIASVDIDVEKLQRQRGSRGSCSKHDDCRNRRNVGKTFTARELCSALHVRRKNLDRAEKLNFSFK